MVDLVYKTDAESLAQAERLERALTSEVYEFGVGDQSFKGKIWCLQREKNKASIREDPRRSYFIYFDRKPTALMYECMWDVFKESLEPFKRR